jgi:hypothetical protein
MSNRKTLILSPCLMYKDDLFALEALLHENMPNKGYDFQISGVEHGHEISAKTHHSLEKLFSEKNLPLYLDQISFETKEAEGGDKLTHSARIHLDKRVSDIMLHGDDGEWLHDIGQKLTDFIKQRRPWYWFIGISIPPVFNVSLGLSLLMVAFIIVTKVDQAYIFPFMVVLSGGVFMALGVSRVLYRHARICLFQKEEDKRPNYELFAILFHVTILVTGIAGTIILTAGKM